MTKSKLDNLIECCKVQPIGRGYIDCIVTLEYVQSFMIGLKDLGIHVTGLTWWCFCNEQNKDGLGCPHGLGGPKSKYFDGWFSEIIDLPVIKFDRESNIIDYIFSVAPNQTDYKFLECFTPALWLAVPDDWCSM